MIDKNKQLTISVPATETLDTYVAQVNTIPKLDIKREQELILLKDAADENIRKQAAHELILANLWYVIYEAKSFSGYKLPLSDLIQEGNIGLMKAIDKFSPEYKVRVSTYAKMWIRSAITEYVINNSKIVRFVTTKAQRKLFFNLHSNKDYLGSLTNKKVKELSEKLNVKPTEVREMEQRFAGQCISYDPLHLDDNSPADEQHLSPKNYIEAAQLDPYQQLLEDDTTMHTDNMIKCALDTLSERDRDIIKSRWMSDEKPTLHDLSDKYGVSAERIRQLEANAIKRISSYVCD